jgi:hypothetical protein
VIIARWLFSSAAADHGRTDRDRHRRKAEVYNVINELTASGISIT